MGFLNFFKKIGSFFTNIFKSKKLEQAVKTLSGLTEIAFPIVEMVARATPTQADDLIVRAAKAGGLSIYEILNSTNDLIKDGGRQKLALEALRIRLMQLVQEKGKVDAKDFTLESIADVLNLDKTTLLTAIQAAFFFYKQIQKASK